MAKLFLYYSLSGNGDVVAAHMQQKGYDVRKISVQKELPKAMFPRIMQGGFLAGLGAKAKLKDFDPNIGAYDEVAIGSPIWNGRPATPFNAVMPLLDLAGKRVTFVFYAGGGSAPRTLKQMAKRYPQAAAVVLKEPKSNPAELDKLP